MRQRNPKVGTEKLSEPLFQTTYVQVYHCIFAIDISNKEDEEKAIYDKSEPRYAFEGRKREPYSVFDYGVTLVFSLGYPYRKIRY